MPLIWRYLLRNYFQVFFLCVLGFISVLLVTRFQEIAKFAASTTSLRSVGLFTLYQIPYILPLAVPVSCLISSILLLQKLSHTHELTALRASGFGITPLAYPLMLAGALIGFMNFTITSEIAPYSKSLSKQLVYELIAKNPLVIMQKDTVMKLRGTYTDMKSFQDGKIAKEVILISKNSANDRLGIMTAKTLSIEGELLHGKDVAFISSFSPKQEDLYDHLLIENQKIMNTQSANLSQHMQTADWLKGSDFLPLKLLIAKQFMEKKASQSFLTSSAIEIAKRITLGLAGFTFTMIGVCYGLEIGRYKRKKGIIHACLLASFFMISFVMTKSFKHAPVIACMAYLVPHPIILFFCIRNMRQVARGIE